MLRLALAAACATLAACGPRAIPRPPDPAPPPVAAAAPAATRTQPPSDMHDCRCITICFLRDGQLREVPARFNAVTRDTFTADGLPFSTIAPLTGEYASVAGWFVNDEPITFSGRRYRRYGHPRVLGIMQVMKAGAYRGVPVFVEMGIAPDSAEALYLPYRPGCEFQPYMPAAKTE